MEQLLSSLAEHGGPVGVSLALAYLYIRQQHSELMAVQDQRVKDAKSMVDKLLELNDKWNETINAQIEVSEAQKAILADVQNRLPARR